MFLILSDVPKLLINLGTGLFLIPKTVVKIFTCLIFQFPDLFYDFFYSFEQLKLYILKSLLDHTSSNYLGINSTFRESVDSLL